MTEDKAPRRDFAKALERIEELLHSLPNKQAQEARLKIKQVRELLLDQRPPRFALVGRRGSGKSSLINALFGEQVAAVGHERAQTGKPTWFSYKTGRGQLDFLDTRGFQEAHDPEESDDADDALTSILEQLEKQCPDAILFLVKASEAGSALEGDFAQLQTVHKRLRKVHGAKVPVVAVVTQCDLVEPKAVQLHDAEQQDDEDYEEKLQRVKRLERQVEEQVRDVDGALDDAFVAAIGVSAYQSWRKDGTLRADERWRIDDLVAFVYEKLPQEARLELVRLAQAKKLQRRMARTLSSTIASACAVVAFTPIPVGDIAPITSLQVMLVSGIGYIGGRSLDLKTAKDFLAAAGINIGAGFALREAARALVKLVPGIGSVASAAIAFAGTMGIGEAAASYFIDNTSMDEAKRRMAAATDEAREQFESTREDR